MAQFETGAVGTVYFEPGGVFFRDGLIPLGMQQPATLRKPLVPAGEQRAQVALDSTR